VAYADVYTTLNGADGRADVTDYLAGEGDHPNSDGHTVLAAAVVDAVDH
jgi:lysophospholipase L1-like esterase